jgi:Alpha/beta hydrolase domain
VPVATYTGWNLRHAAMGAPDQLMSLMGATIPFPVTREAREAGGDPRNSIEERYPTKAEYITQVRRAAQALVADGYLLAEDLELVVSQASQRYELVLRHAEEPPLTGD